MVRVNPETKKLEICLVEVFKSIDGEGFHSGQPTVFVRTFGCNCACSFCDTKESLTEDKFNELYPNEQLRFVDKDTLINEIEELEKDFPNKSICLTGGEPLLPENDEFMIDFIKDLIKKGYAVNVETNGAVDYRPWRMRFRVPYITDDYGNRVGLSLITDWKLPHSKMNKKMIESNLSILTEYDLIKCVISNDPEDWEEFERICKSGTKAKIYLSPCFGEVDMPKIPEFVYNHPEYKITAQIQAHKVFWDPKTKRV